jgi:hypothetical protein
LANVYQTPDQGIAAFLCCEGFVFLGAVPTSDPRIFEFVFLDEPVVLTDDKVVRMVRSLKKEEDRYTKAHPLKINDAINLYVTGEGFQRSKQFFAKMRLVRQALRSPLSREEIDG